MSYLEFWYPTLARSKKQIPLSYLFFGLVSKIPEPEQVCTVQVIRCGGSTTVNLYWIATIAHGQTDNQQGFILFSFFFPPLSSRLTTPYGAFAMAVGLVWPIPAWCITAAVLRTTPSHHPLHMSYIEKYNISILL
jgi:hypothetical protein